MAEKDPKMVRLGGRIRELREGAGRSREQLAAAAGVSVRAVVQWELGEREPGWFNMLALAEALGVDCAAFTQAPAERPAARPGRPRKEPAAEPMPKRPRGRPRNAAALAVDAAAREKGRGDAGEAPKRPRRKKEE